MGAKLAGERSKCCSQIQSAHTRRRPNWRKKWPAQSVRPRSEEQTVGGRQTGSGRPQLFCAQEAPFNRIPIRFWATFLPSWPDWLLRLGQAVLSPKELLAALG